MKEIKEFETVWPLVSNDTLIGRAKTNNIYNELIQTLNLIGHTAEIGVYKGHTSKFIHEICDHKTHYCYDTFEGVALTDKSIDSHNDGDFACSLEKVIELVGNDNVIYKIGVFPNTFHEKDEVFSFVHSDTDTYAGTKTTLECFANIMIKNGKIFFDDYKWKACLGVEKAVKEFLETNTNYALQEFETQCQCVLTRIA